jgi:hypothetical protein
VRPKANTPFRLQCKEPWLIRIGSLDDCKNVIFLDKTVISSVQRSRNKYYPSANDLERDNGRAMEQHGATMQGMEAMEQHGVAMQGMEGQLPLGLSLSFAPGPVPSLAPSAPGTPVCIRNKKLRNKKLQKLQHRVFPCGPPP